jgi:hypothetical protein
MGLLNLLGAIDEVGFDEALKWHLRYNCFPAVPESMIPVCNAAIDAINDGDIQKEIDLPQGFIKKTCSAARIVRTLHLDAFCG